jgi:hypothetical protein
LKNSVEAQSSAEQHVLARLEAGLLDRLHDESSAASPRQVRREAALVADIGVVAGLLQRAFFSVWNISAPQRTASEKLSARRPA